MKDKTSAFPMGYSEDPDTKEFFSGQVGMDLRDYFAAKAMQALIISGKFNIDSEITLPSGNVRKTRVDKNSTGTKNAYQIADAMMQERKK